MIKTIHNKICITRGDTGLLTLEIYDPDGNQFVPEEGSTLLFKMDYKWGNMDPPILSRQIPLDTMTLDLEPEDTNGLDFGEYCYDIELHRPNGMLQTVITNHVLITHEIGHTAI